MGEELLHQVALCLTPGIGVRTIRKLISYCGSASEVFRANVHQLSKIPGMGPKTISAIHQQTGIKEAQQEIDGARKLNIRLIFYNHPQYPQRLSKLDDAPLLLYGKGDFQFSDRPTLGIVGTRNLTSYGLAIIEDFLSAWKAFDPVIISGLAYGVDIAVHRSAIQEGLTTVGVLGNSLDILYPPVHSGTAKRMLKNGGLLSELRLGTKPDSFQFPKRNRIIAGLSDALVIIEARESGGALITADFARKFGRMVYAVPGPVNSLSSKGCLKLIRQGAAEMLCRPQELTDQMKWSAKSPRKAVDISSEHPPQIAEIIEVMQEKPQGMHIDEISWKTQLPINRTGSLLLDMEFEGLVKCLPGKKFSLIHK
ncbi:MAG: DNA-processing protein DprA [Cyclobacteriaceae bacterium]|nr:DNA-processing protein DprA [Cyclobacteriaceae bacterium]